MQLNFNASTVKPNTSLEAVPSDTYIVMITAANEKPVKDKPHCSYLELEETIQDGAYKGRKVYDRLNLNNDNEKAKEIAYATLSAICHVTQRLQIQHSSQLCGVPFKAVVIKKPRNDTPPGTPPDQIQYNNEIRGYKDMNGNDPGFAGGPQGAQAGGGGQPAWANNNGGQGGGQQQAPQQGQGGHQGGAAPQQQPPANQPPAWQQGGGNNGQQGGNGQQAPAQQVSEGTGENQPQQQAPAQQGDQRPPWARG